MPEFVYALHDFLPENEDEIAFLAGDRIEVVEKDDDFGDGWWQGKNLQGHVGLFPQTYTAPAPSVAPDDNNHHNDGAPLHNGDDGGGGSSFLHPLNEESETNSTPAIHAPIPKSPAILQQNGDHDSPSDELASSSSSTMSDVAQQHRKIGSGSDGEMMKATMTDVQQAIEQLGRHDHEATEDGDGGRSFSFASSRDGGETETDTDYENSIDDGDPGTAGAGRSFHVDARKRLADTARRAIEDAEKLQEIGNSKPSDRKLMMAPPIDCELSDESDGDEDYQQHTESYRRTHPEIPEEDEEEIQEVPVTEPPNPAPVSEANSDDTNKNQNTVNSDSSAYTTAQSSTSQSIATTIVNASSIVALTTSSSDQTWTSIRSEEIDKARAKASSPLNIEKKTSTETRPPEPRRSSSPRSIGYVGVTSLDGVVRAVSPQQFLDQNVFIPPTMEQEREKDAEEKNKEKNPTEWTVEDVTEWLNSKGFDQDVQSKFIEQEITGDVLLELDVNLLKTEIGIMAFGKRSRIEKEIQALRSTYLLSGSPSYHAQNGHQFQPSSLQHSPQFIVFPGVQDFASSGSGGGGGHVRSYSASQNSQRSFPGSVSVPPPGLPMLYTQSMPPGTGGAGLPQSTSLPSPLVVGSFGLEAGGGGGGNGGNGGGGGVGKSGGSGTAESVRGSLASREDRIGLGLSEVGEEEEQQQRGVHRPAHLSLSPSGGASSDNVQVVNGDEGGDGIEEEERGHLSETEVTAAKKARRRLFGLSQDSSVSRVDSSSRISKDVSSSTSTPSSLHASPVVKDPVLDKEVKTYVRPKKGAESKSERLSIFGATFPTSLGKGRKPPPRYSVDENSEKSSLFPLPRLASTVGRKASTSIRPLTPNGSPKWLKEEKEKAKEKEKEQANTLRKRSTSLTRSPGLTPVAGVTAAKKGKEEKDKDKAESPVIGVNGGAVPVKQGQSILEQIGEPDHFGWMRKRGDRYNAWRMRYFVLSGPHLYWLRSNSKSETKIKGYLNIMGYKVTVDETVDPGKYGFRIEHNSDRTHYFSSDDKMIIREWMKAIMKATIARDYSEPIFSSCNIPTIPLTVAQAMNPAPRPPSPSARAATQKAHRNKDLETLGVKDLNEVPTHATLVLMGLQPGQASSEDRAKVERDDEDLGGGGSTPKPTKSFGSPVSPAPPRPVREAKRQSTRGISGQLDAPLIEWANSHLAAHLRVSNPFEQTFSALALFRLAESIKGRPASPPVPDSAFPTHPQDDKAIEGLFSLFDFLVNNEVKMGSVSINDIRLQRPDKVAQIVKALKNWEDRKRFLAHGHFSQAYMPMNGALSYA